MASLAALAPSGAAAAAEGDVRLDPPAPLPLGATVAAPAPSEQRLRLTVALEPRDAAGLEDFATAVSTPGSPLYGEYLSVAGFARRFGPTEAAVARVRAALRASGLEVGEPGANRLLLPVSATVAEAEAAFGVTVRQVETASGRIAHRNDRAPAVPAAVAPLIQGVLGLDNVTLPARRGPDRSAASPAITAGAGSGASTAATRAAAAEPCAEALEVQEKLAEAEIDGYTPNQIAAAYRLNEFYAAGNTGEGEKIALLELEPYNHENVATYQACYGTDVAITDIDVEGGPEGEHESGEAGLDVEQLIGLAPGADILVYQGPNEAEVQILARIVEDNAARVISSSWGACEKETSKAERDALDTLLQEAAAQGQSFFVAAGDNGSTDCFPSDGSKELAVDFPGSLPFATSVGGTRLETPSAPPTEYIWNDGPESYAGGGGISKEYAMPAYQLGAAPALGVIGPLSSGGPCGASGYCRQVPDVSASADSEKGYLVLTESEEGPGEYASGWTVVGGTSAAAPLWAAFATLANASPECAGHAIGFANPALYAIAGRSYAGGFNDITAARPGGLPTNNQFDPSEPYPPGPAYDMATGIGSPVGPPLAASLCELANPPAPPAPAPAPQPAQDDEPRVRNAALLGAIGNRVKLRLGLVARPGATARQVALRLPRGFAVSTSPRDLARGVAAFGPGHERLKIKARARGRSIVVRLPEGTAAARVRAAGPAIRVLPKLSAWIKRHRKRTLKFVVVARESGDVGARFKLGLRP